MRHVPLLAFLILTLIPLGSARAEEGASSPFDESPLALSPSDLDDRRGGTVVQENQSYLLGSNNGDISVADNSAKLSGMINPAQIVGNRGITTVLQNTGDLVNFTTATSINVYTR